MTADSNTPSRLPGVIVLPDAEAVARRAAEEMVNVAQRCVAERGTFITALSGGSTPNAMYQLLAGDEELRARMPWWQTHWFWSDERHVPPSSADSNYHMACEAMLANSPAPAANIHRVPAELPDAAEIARTYEQELISTFLALGRAIEPAPSFDVLLLGMGTDGHTASLFPNTAALSEQNRFFVENWVPKLSGWRFTVSPLLIAAAERAMVLVCGQDKAAALDEVLSSNYNPEKLPVQLVTKRNRPTIWLVDQPAAGLLTK